LIVSVKQDSKAKNLIKLGKMLKEQNKQSSKAIHMLAKKQKQNKQYPSLVCSPHSNTAYGTKSNNNEKNIFVFALLLISNFDITNT